MSRRGSSGGGQSSLSYLFEPEEIITHHVNKSSQETKKTTMTNSNSLKDDKVTAGEANQEPPVIPAAPKKEVSDPIVSSHRPPCNIYHTSQLSHNSGLLITDRPSTRVRYAPGFCSVMSMTNDRSTKLIYKII
ncbi:hypothetical protein PR202_gb14610 [Eleusine coracana subsp. coracana]|uniref:Uncharacterized protein n=1 Tax=Eleusine coracana subsp. coracana TaxID=191504 RepID=A0AAV5EVS4_ELECO|nr:hypothetical protein PR202_gb14610 [Eleusine coracana subsp. coracana]